MPLWKAYITIAMKTPPGCYSDVYIAFKPNLLPVSDLTNPNLGRKCNNNHKLITFGCGCEVCQPDTTS